MTHLKLFLLIAALQLRNGMIQAGEKGLSIEKTYRMVEICYQAAPLNPSWGDRETVTLRLLAAIHHESRFKEDAKQCANSNKSCDYGLGQINSIHLHKTFPDFCNRMGFKYSPGLIWSPLVNVEFSAYINELQIKSGGRTYVYNNTNQPQQKIVWAFLNRTPGFVKALEKDLK